MLTLKALARRRGDDEKGFTLIELMVVVLIIAILIAIAIPTFLGARGKANDRAAQSSLRNALTAAKTAYTDKGDYSGANAAGLTTIEPSLTFQTAGSPSFKVVSVQSSGQYWWAEVQSASGKCFGILDNSGATPPSGTSYIGGTTALPPVASLCTAPTSAPTTWTDTSF